jgi:hypothetical protein
MAKFNQGDQCIVFRLMRDWSWYKNRKQLCGKRIEVGTDPLEKLPGGYVAGVVRLLEDVPNVGPAGMQIHIEAILRKV